jgi:hypothetical protein
VFVDGTTTLRASLPATPSMSGRYALVLVFDSLPPGEPPRSVYARVEQPLTPEELAARKAATARGGSAVSMADGLIDLETGSLGYAAQAQLSMHEGVALGGEATPTGGARRYVVDAGVGEVEVEYRTFLPARDPTNRMSLTVPAHDVEHVVDAGLPTRTEAELLEIHADEPCLTLMRRTWTSGVAVTFARFVHPGSRYRLGCRFTPDLSQRQG